MVAAVHVDASGLHFFAGNEHCRQGVCFFRWYPLEDAACLRKDLDERTTEDFAQSDREAEAHIDVGLRSIRRMCCWLTPTASAKAR